MNILFPNEVARKGGRSRPVLPRATALPTAKNAVKASKAIESALKTDLCDSLVGFRKQTKLPHFVNVSAGGVIQWIGEHFPETKITVLCGHAHLWNTVRIADDIDVRVGQARKGLPTIQEIIEV